MKKLILSLFVAVGMIGSASASTLTGSLTNGLASYYDFNGNANDSVGGNHATVYGAILTNGITGSGNSAYYFNGSSSYMTASYTPQTNNLFTWSVWVNSQSSNIQAILQQHRIGENGGGPSLFSGWPYNLSEVVFTSYDDSLSGDQNTAYNFMNSGFILPQNQWTLLTVTSDQSNLRSIYIDGNLYASLTSSGWGQISDSIIFGADRFLNNFWFQGSLTDIGIWNRALSSAEVSQLYGIQSVPEPSTYGLFGIGAIGMLMVMRRKKTA